MEIISAVANIRGITEREIVNTYTYRQLYHIGMTHVKDRMMVLEIVSRSLAQIKPGNDNVNEVDNSKNKNTIKRTLPSWYQPPSGRHSVIDLDGPMEVLEPYIGSMGGLKSGKEK